VDQLTELPDRRAALEREIDQLLAVADISAPSIRRMIASILSGGTGTPGCMIAGGHSRPTAQLGRLRSPTVTPTALPLLFQPLGLPSHVGPDFRDARRLLLKHLAVGALSGGRSAIGHPA